MKPGLHRRATDWNGQTTDNFSQSMVAIIRIRDGTKGVNLKLNKENLFKSIF
jgi:hypothetical protein